MKLTDKQVEALADCYHRGVTHQSRVVTDPDREPVDAHTVRALATEVLASRGRRCGACAHFFPEYSDTWGVCREPRLDVDDGSNRSCGGPDVTADFFCAYFTPKEAK